MRRRRSRRLLVRPSSDEHDSSTICHAKSLSCEWKMAGPIGRPIENRSDIRGHARTSKCPLYGRLYITEIKLKHSCDGGHLKKIEPIREYISFA